MSQKLVLENINKNFGSLVAVRDVNLEIEPGEFLCFLGPSGCGKTTLLRIITGFEYPSSGTIKYDDKVINHIIPQKRDFGIVFQSYALFPNMTVEQNVAFGLKMRRMPKKEIAKRVEEILSLVGLNDWRTHYPAQLSGGQQQRVALGRAIAIKPKVLLLDEPLSALDAKIRVRLRTVIKRLQSELGITMIYVTHDQEEALSMADRIAIMKDGNIRQIGSPWEIYRKPASSFVAGFVGTSNFMAGAIENGVARIDGYVFKVDGLEEIKQKEIYLAIRPEKIQLITDLTNMAEVVESNIVEATAEVVTFLGAVVQITFTLDGMEMNVDITEDEFERMEIRRGTRIRLYFPPDCFHLYTEKPSSIM
jgi:putative 2-aminoethylphosphonate ABC transporter ATP-binding protein